MAAPLPVGTNGSDRTGSFHGQSGPGPFAHDTSESAAQLVVIASDYLHDRNWRGLLHCLCALRALYSAVSHPLPQVGQEQNCCCGMHYRIFPLPQLLSVEFVLLLIPGRRQRPVSQGSDEHSNFAGSGHGSDGAPRIVGRQMDRELQMGPSRWYFDQAYRSRPDAPLFKPTGKRCSDHIRSDCLRHGDWDDLDCGANGGTSGRKTSR